MSENHQNNANILVDEHTTTYENPFKFSGKELDDITGLYDHGARSRNPLSTLWYGIDPLFEKYPDFSPYNYCAGNPVKLVDPDGRKHRKNQSNNYLGPMTSECRKSFKKSQKGKPYSPKQKPYKFVPITPGLGFDPNSKPDEDIPEVGNNPEGSNHPTGVALGCSIIYQEFKYCGVENNEIKDDISKFISSILEENTSDIEYQVISLNKNETESSNTVKDAILSTDYNIEFKEYDDIIIDTDETKAQLSKEGEYEVIICIRTIKEDE